MVISINIINILFSPCKWMAYYKLCKRFVNHVQPINLSCFIPLKAYSASKVDMETMDQKKLHSSWPNVQYVPDSYVHPPEKRPGKLVFPTCKTIPIIDLEGQDRIHVIQNVLNASNEFGFFQVHILNPNYLFVCLFSFPLIFSYI